LLSFLKHSAVYWQPGRSTSIPSALLTAQSLGIPAVANDISAHAQVITHGENGFLVPTEKRATWTRHTVELLENSALREQCAEVARSVIAERLTLSTMLQAYEKLTI
jgi:glycosyltransferase involved in cell wall biosynthesis